MIPDHIHTALIRVGNNYPSIKEILLFGSRVRGDFEERSDIDLAVVTEDMAGSEWLECLDEIHEISTLLKFDIIFWGSSPEELKVEIEKCHRILYKE